MIKHPLVLEGASLTDMRYVAENMRAADRAEVAAASGLTPLEALRSGRLLSNELYTLVSPAGNPAAIFGVVPNHNVMGGVVWLLGTDDMTRYALAFHRGVKPQWEAMARRWGCLCNFVDSRNKVHIRWLEWLGCEFFRPFPVGRSKVPFIPFIKRPHV